MPMSEILKRRILCAIENFASSNHKIFMLTLNYLFPNAAGYLKDFDIRYIIVDAIVRNNSKYFKLLMSQDG